MNWNHDFEAVAVAVRGWANGKGIARKESATHQMGKMIEEVMELDKEVGLNDIDGIKDELGDVLEFISVLETICPYHNTELY